MVGVPSPAGAVVSVGLADDAEVVPSASNWIIAILQGMSKAHCEAAGFAFRNREGLGVVVIRCQTGSVGSPR